MFNDTQHPPLPFAQSALASNGSPSCRPGPGQVASTFVRLLLGSTSFIHIGLPIVTDSLGVLPPAASVMFGRTPDAMAIPFTENTLPWCIDAYVGTS